MSRVLVVDDQSEKRTAFAAALTEAFVREGTDMSEVSVLGVCSAEAMDAAQRGGAQLAIVDLMLHGTNGFELARRLRSEAPAVRVILTSDYHFSPTQLDRMDCGAIAFVPRPVQFSELAEFLRTKLDELRTISYANVAAAPVTASDA